MPRTLAQELRVEGDPIKGSRFIATVAPVADESAARALVQRLRLEMPDANHHCAAWRIATGSIERASDDGEPSGSAGRPILAMLQGRDLVNAAAVVTRYFGGTKLGVGGLVRAYGASAAAALDAASVVAFVPKIRLHIAHGYPHAPEVERVLASWDANDEQVEYDAGVSRTLLLPQDQYAEFCDALRDATRGAARVRRLDS